MTDSNESDPSDASAPSLDQAIANLLVLSVWELRRVAHRAFEPLNLTTHQVAILNLIAQDPQVRSGELAERLGIIPVTVSTMITKLEKLGLLERVTTQSDRRGRNVSLTEAGEALRLEANALWKAVTTSRYEKISHSDKEALLRGLQVIHSQTKNIEP